MGRPAGRVDKVEDQLRRRSVGAPAARSVLLTLLGEFVLPAGGAVWQETLVRSLETLGHRTQAARQAVARSVSAGWLATERRGRRSRLELTTASAEMLRRGAERIYTFGDAWHWDGRWLLVVVRVPEQRRELRHRVRTQLAWAGFGSLGGGLWISPHCEREPQLGEAVGNGAVGELLSFHAELGRLGDPARVIAQAWDLEAVAAAYREFIAGHGGARAPGAEAFFRAQTRLVHEWRRFPFLDPDLPDDVLPARWPRRRAHDLFHRRHGEWAGPARDFFAGLEG